MRYEVVEGSQSAHCCFEFTIVDTTKPTMIGGKQYNNQFEPVCECYTREDADTICTALNRVLLKGNPRPGIMGWAD